MDEVFAKFPISDLCPHNSLAGIGTECENQCGWGWATAAPGVCHVSSSVNSARASCQAAVVSACRSRGNACGLRRCKSSSRLRVLVTAQKQVMFFWTEGGVGFVWRWGAQGRAFSGEVFCSSVGAGVYTRGARIALWMHFLPRLPRRVVQLPTAFFVGVLVSIGKSACRTIPYGLVIQDESLINSVSDQRFWTTRSPLSPFLG